MTWSRPVPLVGDTTSAAQRAADPGGWALGADTVDALDAVIASRRDIRRFRPDPVPDELLRDVLAAAHRAPSVGHSQPWRFIVITEQGTRDHAALLADRGRLRQAQGLGDDRRSRLLDLKLEGLREAPVGVVVACDRRAPAAGVLGRATLTDTDLWSCACAIENLWLRARAVGLGVGWVTLFEPADLADLLGLPEGVETLGWLCVGWPDERPPDPGLERAGWSRRLELDDVVLHERWPTDDAPTPPVSHLRGPDQRSVVAAHDTGDDLLTAPGSLGALDVAIDRVLALPGEPPVTGTLILAGGHHPVVRHGVSAYPDTVTDDVLEASEQGQSLGATTARECRLDVRVLRAAPADAQGDLVTTDALTAADVHRLIEQGLTAGRRAARQGLVCLGEVGVGNTTVAAALACATLGLGVDDAVGLGVGSDATILARKADVITRALARTVANHGPALADPHIALAAGRRAGVRTARRRDDRRRVGGRNRRPGRAGDLRRRPARRPARARRPIEPRGRSAESGARPPSRPRRTRPRTPPATPVAGRGGGRRESRRAGPADRIAGPPHGGTGAVRLRRRSRRVLVLGGARSGKSRFAEQFLSSAATVTYVACGTPPDATDPEWAERVRLHRARRPPNWRTLESQDLPAVLRPDSTPALVDCLSTWLATAMDDCGVWSDADGADSALAARIDGLVDAWSASTRHVVAVSNEVGSGVVPATPSGRRYRDELGILNARIAAESDEVWFVVAGIPQRLR